MFPKSYPLATTTPHTVATPADVRCHRSISLFGYMSIPGLIVAEIRHNATARPTDKRDT